MNAWQMSIWCWVIFVVGMIGMLPALIFGVPGLVAEQVVTWAAFGYGMYLSMVVIRGGDKRLARNGVPGTALVLSADQTNTVVQEGEFAWEAPYVWKYGLEVTVPGWQPYKTMLYICASLSAGETVPVRVARFNRKRVTIDRDAYNKQYSERGNPARDGRPEEPSDDFGAALANVETLATRRRGAQTTAAEPDVADELAKLAALRDKGILTDAEFAAQKAKLLAR
jgi:Short C-terminal domain